MKQQVRVSLRTDEDGFISQECPACRKRFKVAFGEGSDRPVAYCPYCGHRGEDCWWTREQAAYLRGMAGKAFVTPMLEKFARDISRMNRPGSLISVDAKIKRAPAPRKPVEPSSFVPITVFECCDERVKHDDSVTQLHCIICGAVKAI